MRLTVRLFAALAEGVGVRALELDLPAGAPAGAVRDLLRERFPAVEGLCRRSVIAVNAAYVDDREALQDGILNHPFVLTQAKRLAERLAAEVPSDDNARIERAYQLLFSRAARPEEVEVCRAFLFRPGMPRADADWPGLAHLLLCSNEFVYVD